MNLVTGQDVLDHTYLSLRNKWLYNVSNQLSFKLSLDYSHNRGSNGIFSGPSYVNRLASFDAVTGKLFYVQNFYDTNVNYPPLFDARTGGVSLNIEADFGWAKGVSITSWREGHAQIRAGYDGGPSDFIDLPFTMTDQDETQEFQLLSSPDSPVKWVGGLFFFNERGAANPFEFAGPAASAVVPPQAGRTTL